MFIYGRYTCTAAMLLTTRHTTLLSQILFLLVPLNLYYPMQPDTGLCVCLLGSVMYKTQQSDCFLLQTHSLQCLVLVQLIYHADMFQTRVAYSPHFTQISVTKLHGQSVLSPRLLPLMLQLQSFGEKWVFPKLCLSVIPAMALICILPAKYSFSEWVFPIR